MGKRVMALILSSALFNLNLAARMPSKGETAAITGAVTALGAGGFYLLSEARSALQQELDRHYAHEKRGTLSNDVDIKALEAEAAFLDKVLITVGVGSAATGVASVVLAAKSGLFSRDVESSLSNLRRSEGGGVDFSPAVDNEWPVRMGEADRKLPQTVTLPPIRKALLKALHELNLECADLLSSSDFQKKVLPVLLPRDADNKPVKLGDFVHGMGLNKLTKEELFAQADYDPEVLEKVLKERGFDIRFSEREKKNLKIISILDLAFKWKEKGVLLDRAAPDAPGGDRYKYVSMKRRLETGLKFLSDELSSIETKSGDVVWFLNVNEEEPREFELLNRIREAKSELPKNPAEYRTDESILHFPHVDINETVDIKWLEKVRFLDGKSYISEAKQQTKFKLDEKGGKVESAVTLGVEKSAAPDFEKPKIRVLDKNFICWVERPGVKDPIFAGLITRDNWVKSEK